MEGPVPGLQRRARGTDQPAQCVLDGIVGKVGIEPAQRGAQARLQDHLPIVGAFRVRRNGGDVRAVGVAPTDPFKPTECGVLSVSFRK